MRYINPCEKGTIIPCVSNIAIILVWVETSTFLPLDNYNLPFYSESSSWQVSSCHSDSVTKIMIIFESCIKKKRKLQLFSQLYAQKWIYLPHFGEKMRQINRKWGCKKQLCHNIPNVLDCFITFFLLLKGQYPMHFSLLHRFHGTCFSASCFSHLLLSYHPK